ncbi:hypothetical protein [Paludisphaera rhizosphaerae]|uniref:hypothetical protein n=1 Tax=Paludisphaera rhizosphaerae TaxID=2711216 RepID=UPI0013EAEF95|nr:hypothetical protein [Paludisphaera rhizosphaerae]
MSTSSARVFTLANAAPSALAVASGALVSFGLAGLAFGSHAAAPLLTAAAGSAALAWYLSGAERPQEVDQFATRVARASAAAVDAFRSPSAVVSPKPVQPRPVNRLKGHLAAVPARLKAKTRAGRVRLSRGIYRLAMAVAPK